MQGEGYQRLWRLDIGCEVWIYIPRSMQQSPSSVM